jgi:uncharacterized protein YcaQ
VPKKITTTLENARRLAVAKQHLAGKRSERPSSDEILELIRNLGCLQLDPISAVAPSHLIVLWSRLGAFDTSELDKLLWSEKKLFEYWAHQASIVLMEDYPLYYYMMRGYPDVFLRSLGPVWRARVKKWLGKNSDLRDYVLTELKQKGPLLSRQFEDKTRAKPRGFGWSSWSDVSRMLSHLYFKGEVMVVGRLGKQKLWDISERFLPSWVPRKELSEQEVQYEAVQRSLRALGTANESEISWHFLRGRYRNLKDTLKQLEAESKIQTVDIADGPLGKGARYIHSRDLQLLDELDSGNWEPRVSLLSPFDNLFCDRARTKLLFNFDYTIEIYTPQNKRKYGYYVLPILYGDKFIGRIDPLMDRKNEKLLIKAVYAEPDAPKNKDVSREIRDSVEQLSEFLGAKEIVYSRKVPRYWHSHLH